MPQSTFSIRMEENLKTQFEGLCDSFGMNMNTAFNVSARAVVRERRIPFEICISRCEWQPPGSSPAPPGPLPPGGGQAGSPPQLRRRPSAQRFLPDKSRC